MAELCAMRVMLLLLLVAYRGQALD